PVGPDDLLVRYTMDEDRCPTSLVDRYVPTPAEEVTRALLDVLPPGGVQEVDGPAPGARRVVVHATTRYGGFAHPLLWAVDLAPEPGGLTVTLHSNQLRGHAFNQRFLANALVERPRIVLTSAAGERREIVVAVGHVGHFAA